MCQYLKIIIDEKVKITAIAPKSIRFRVSSLSIPLFFPCPKPREAIARTSASLREKRLVKSGPITVKRFFSFFMNPVTEGGRSATLGSLGINKPVR